jgi:spermidine/putrescine transport system ATP-binding protein
MEVSVELKKVTKEFDDVKAVDNVSIKIRRGEFFSLLGPSGCGKTTTLRLVAGFEAPTVGEIFINNQNVSDKRPYERNVNTVFQNYALFPHLTVAGNIRFGLERKKTPPEKITGLVNEALDLVQMKDMGDRYPRQLSGGQQQRIALARSLVLRPEVLLLDEPLGALDLKLRKAMQVELKNLQERVGITFIYVTHDQEEALTMSDRIGVMAEGRLEQVGTPEEIYDFPKTSFVADFIGVSNFFSGQIVSASGDEMRVKTEGGLDVVMAAGPKKSQADQVLFSIRPEKINIQPQARTSAHENQFVGKIANRMYLGDSIHYIIELSEHEQVTFFLKQRETGEKQMSYSKGDTVYVSWHKNSPVILAD